ncbi:hypothetical protein M422DRAFT_268282 [Sphaerobolus stellatus SS14]|uniref:Uncharacterized protein n=1 Tax=Sphaerobolus stellatus (strain SS14) TaxID=990650 RepID=A0A0C9UN15_SPHS4|nr:hypothetical protein M422DRAFT_268282 [Sphaerobolus stellatus SS14]
MPGRQEQPACSAREVFRQCVPLPADLPSISLSFKAVAGQISAPGQWNDDEADEANLFVVWSIAAAAMAEPAFPHETLVCTPRLSNGDIIPTEHLSSLNQKHRLKSSVLTAYFHWLQDYLDNHPIA